MGSELPENDEECVGQCANVSLKHISFGLHNVQGANQSSSHISPFDVTYIPCAFKIHPRENPEEQRQSSAVSDPEALLELLLHGNLANPPGQNNPTGHFKQTLSVNSE